MYSVGLKTSAAWSLKGTVMAPKPKNATKWDNFCPFIFQILNWNALIRVIAISLVWAATRTAFSCQCDVSPWCPGFDQAFPAFGGPDVWKSPSLESNSPWSNTLRSSPKRERPLPKICPHPIAPRPVAGLASFPHPWARARQQVGNFCLREVWNTDLNVWCWLFMYIIVCVWVRMGKEYTGSFLARGCLESLQWAKMALPKHQKLLKHTSCQMGS